MNGLWPLGFAAAWVGIMLEYCYNKGRISNTGAKEWRIHMPLPEGDTFLELIQLRVCVLKGTAKGAMRQ